MDLNIQVQAKIVMPDVPDEIKTENGLVYNVADMSENALRKIADAWKKELLTKCKNPSIDKKPAAPASTSGAGASDKDK